MGDLGGSSPPYPSALAITFFWLSKRLEQATGAEPPRMSQTGLESDQFGSFSHVIANCFQTSLVVHVRTERVELKLEIFSWCQAREICNRCQQRENIKPSALMHPVSSAGNMKPVLRAGKRKSICPDATGAKRGKALKWYYDQKTLFFSSDFETLFRKHFRSEILGLHFEKKTVYLNYNFPIQCSAIITPERIQWRHLLMSFRMQCVNTAY